MKRYLVGFQNVILEQLKLNEEVYIHNFGTFYLRQSGGDIRTMGDMKTKKVKQLKDLLLLEWS